MPDMAVTHRVRAEFILAVSQTRVLRLGVLTRQTPDVLGATSGLVTSLHRQVISTEVTSGVPAPAPGGHDAELGGVLQQLGVPLPGGGGRLVTAGVGEGQARVDGVVHWNNTPGGYVPSFKTTMLPIAERIIENCLVMML